MKNVFFLLFLLDGCFKVNAQIPSTKAKIQSFIDYVGRSSDRNLISSSMYPAVANGANFEWRVNIWKNKKKELLWVESILPDSIHKVFFYCHRKLIFASELTYVTDAVSRQRKPLFRNIFFYKDKIIEDSAPGRNSNTVDYYLERSKQYLKL